MVKMPDSAGCRDWITQQAMDFIDQSDICNQLENKVLPFDEVVAAVTLAILKWNSFKGISILLANHPEAVETLKKINPSTPCTTSH